ncbi:hypothetical protein D3C80_2239940 [compost metagenome]
MSFKLVDIKRDFNIVLKAKADSEAFLASEAYQLLEDNHILKEYIKKASGLD